MQSQTAFYLSCPSESLALQPRALQSWTMWMTSCKGLISFVSSIVDLIHEYNHVTVLSHVYWANRSTIKELLVVTLSNTYQMRQIWVLTCLSHTRWKGLSEWVMQQIYSLQTNERVWPVPGRDHLWSHSWKQVGGGGGGEVGVVSLWQGAKKVIFKACHSGDLKLAYTSPNVISTSPQNILMSRIHFTVPL